VRSFHKKEAESLFHSLYSAYGKQFWWPGDTFDEIIIGAILTQNTNWKNVEKAIAQLRQANRLTLQDILTIPTSQLAELIRSAGYHNQKAIRLQEIAKALLTIDLATLPMEAARNYLLGLKGIGPETADSILLYAYSMPTFVIDAYTKRLMSRLGFCEESIAYANLQKLFVEHLPSQVALFNEYHALIVRHAKEHCLSKPVCLACPLSTNCHYIPKEAK